MAQLSIDIDGLADGKPARVPLTDETPEDLNPALAESQDDRAQWSNAHWQKSLRLSAGPSALSPAAH